MPAPHPPLRPGPGLGPVSRCRSCGAPIQWAYTPAGARTPVDAYPPPPALLGSAGLRPEAVEWETRRHGVEPNVALVDGFAVTLGALELAAGEPKATLVPHWATCPDARDWKAPR